MSDAHESRSNSQAAAGHLDAGHSERSIDAICAGIDNVPATATEPHSPPIYPTSVWRCETTDQADRLLSGAEPGYVYQRESHPNADVFTHKAAQLHRAEFAVAAGSGMAALSMALLATARTGDELVASDQLYGRTTVLLRDEADRLGMRCTFVDPIDLLQWERAISEKTRLMVVETVSNPGLRVADIPQLAALARRSGITLLVDNTFATPLLCRPLAHGAELVMESVSKMINGHSDVMLGLLAGTGAQVGQDRIRSVAASFGLSSSPFDCWLASRGLATFPLRMRQACHNAMHLAAMLQEQQQVKRVVYPGLENHPDHALAKELLDGGFGSVVTFELGNRTEVDQFIAACRPEIAFCPSLGELSTTLSHPCSTSHRSLPEKQRDRLGIRQGTIRLSVGIESTGYLVARLQSALRAVRP